MKLKKIVANDIKECHPHQNSHQTDLYYQRLANRLQDAFRSLSCTIEGLTPEVMHQGAIMLANYMEDIVADSGQWRTFSNLCQELYGHPTPLYHQDEEYYPDEPSLNAIRYLLWSVESDVSGELVFPDSKNIELMAIVAHHILEEVFEEAPVNDQLADDVMSELQLATEGFDQLRGVLLWLFSSCYLTAGEQNEKLLEKHADELMELAEHENMPDLSPYLAFFYASTKSIFEHQIGPLALYTKDYLAAMMRTKGMEQQAEDLDKIERIDMGMYKFEPVKTEGKLMGLAPKTKRLRLTRTNGRKIEIEAEELNMAEEMLKAYDGFMASSFVFYLGEWHLNGILLPLSGINKKWEKLCDNDQENLKQDMENHTVDMLLKRTNGLRIAYFANSEQMKDFLKKEIRFPEHLLDQIVEREGELPTLFIDTEDQKGYLQIFYAYSPCIADPDNPFYDQKRAREEAADLLWDAKAVTTHVVKYLLEHDFLPDIYDDDVLSHFSTPAEKRHDIDFLMRFHRRENY
ncbi:MAG: DUF3843 family protein [Prevotella sp.]|nr:DUF3843 family protein [Prevotella sp.]